MSPITEAKVKNIDHLGIVAGLIDEIGIDKWIRICIKTFIFIQSIF
jgi:hypothetical protein